MANNIRDDFYCESKPVTDAEMDCEDSFDEFVYNTRHAPRFLREAYNDCYISYSEFLSRRTDYFAGKPVPINPFDAIKQVYGISMVDIAVVLGVSFGVVYNAKIKGVPAKRIGQLSSGLCIPEKILAKTTTADLEELKECKEEFFARAGIDNLIQSMPEWKANLANEISNSYLRCPIDVARRIARVDKVVWEHGDSLDEYTEYERELIKFVSRENKKYKPVHHLEYSLLNSGHPRMYTKMIKNNI